IAFSRHRSLSPDDQSLRGGHKNCVTSTTTLTLVNKTTRYFNHQGSCPYWVASAADPVSIAVRKTTIWTAPRVPSSNAMPLRRRGIAYYHGFREIMQTGTAGARQHLARRRSVVATIIGPFHA